MKKALLIVMITAMVLTCATGAFAQEFNTETNPVTVSKTADGIYCVRISSEYFAYETITFAVIENGNDLSVLQTDLSKVLYVEETQANRNGEAAIYFRTDTVDFYIAVASAKEFTFNDGTSEISYFKVAPSPIPVVDILNDKVYISEAADQIVTFGQLEVSSIGYDIYEYGIICSDDLSALKDTPDSLKKYKGIAPYNPKGKFGISFIKDVDSFGDEFYIKAYIKCSKAGENYTIYSNGYSTITLKGDE